MRTANEVEGAEVDSDTGKEFVFAIEIVVKDVSLSQIGCEVNEDCLVMIDSRASVNVSPKWFDSSRIRRISSTPRCGRKNTPRLRKASNLAEDRKQLETELFSRGGGDEADPECQLFVGERNRNTLRERPFSELR